VLRGPERDKATAPPKAIPSRTDVDDWFDAYMAGEYRSLPSRLKDVAFEQCLERHLQRFGLMVLADTEIRATCDSETIVDRARAYDGGGTDLVAVVRSIFLGRKQSS
jgi:hypothetical protein